MDNNTENKKMMVKFSELRAMMRDGRIEFDVPGVMLTVDLTQTQVVVNVDAMEDKDRRRTKLRMLSAGLSHLACKVLQGNPKAVGVVAEWDERHYAEGMKKGMLERLAEELGAEQEGEE